MRSSAMLKSTRDTFFVLIIVGIGFLAYFKLDYFIQHPYDYNNIWTVVIIGVFWSLIAYLLSNILASLGASILFANSYDANKEKYKMSFSIYEDKLNGTLFMLKVGLLGSMGAIFLPFALLYTLFNFKKLFTSDKVVDDMETEEKNNVISQNENDITLKTSSKKWCVKDTSGLLPTCYYFHDEDEAEKFAEKNNYDKPQKTIF